MIVLDHTLIHRLMHPMCWWLSEKQCVLSSVASLALGCKYEVQVR